MSNYVNVEPSDIAHALHIFGAQGCWCDLAECIADALDRRKPDKWQMAWTSNASGEPSEDPPDGYKAIGAWQPYAATERNDGWRRPLKMVTP